MHPHMEANLSVSQSASWFRSYFYHVSCVASLLINAKIMLSSYYNTTFVPFTSFSHSLRSIVHEFTSLSFSFTFFVVL